jgi:hypothetical protein
VSKKYVFVLLLLNFLLLNTNKTSAQYNYQAYLNAAKRDIDKNEYATAITKLNICIAAEPGNAEAYFFRAACKYSLFDNVGAEDDFTISISYFNQYYYDALRYRAQVRYRIGKYNEALIV